MSGFLSYFRRRKDPKATVASLRQQLQKIEEKEEHLRKKMDAELKIARNNTAIDKSGKDENELDKLRKWHSQLEYQINALENANMNAETLKAMKKGSDALTVLHGNMTMDKVDAVMSYVDKKRESANDSKAAEARISNPSCSGKKFK